MNADDCTRRLALLPAARKRRTLVQGGNLDGSIMLAVIGTNANRPASDGVARGGPRGRMGMAVATYDVIVPRPRKRFADPMERAGVPPSGRTAEVRLRNGVTSSFAVMIPGVSPSP